MLTAATVGVGSAGGVTVGGSESSLTRSIVEGSVVAIVEGERGELSVHQGMRSQDRRQGRVRVRVTNVVDLLQTLLRLCINI